MVKLFNNVLYLDGKIEDIALNLTFSKILKSKYSRISSP